MAFLWRRNFGWMLVRRGWRGASVKTVQLALGHSTATLNEYVHEWPDALDRTRSLINGALGKPKAAATPARSQA